MSSAELAHYGVKGMKWGVRRAENKKADAKFHDSYSKKSKDGAYKVSSI